MTRRKRNSRAALVAALFLLGGMAAPATAAAIKIGLVRVPASGAVFIAQDKGYFTAEGVPAQIVYFDSSQPIAVAVTSGAIDFGATGITAGFYSLAGQGAMRIIAGANEEAPHFKTQAFLVSNAAYQGGLKSYKDFPGHSYAITQVGSPAEYALGLIAEKYGFDVKSMHILPLQSISNAVSAVAGGRADLTLNSGTAEEAVVQRGAARFLGYFGDEARDQFGLVFTSTKMTDEHRDMVERFLRAYRDGARDFHDAFTGPGATRQDGPTAPEIMAILNKYIPVTHEQLENSIPYVDAQARLDVKDVLHQIAWFKSQNLLKEDVDGDSLIDKRYIIPLPGQ